MPMLHEVNDEAVDSENEPTSKILVQKRIIPAKSPSSQSKTSSREKISMKNAQSLNQLNVRRGERNGGSNAAMFPMTYKKTPKIFYDHE